MEDTKKARKKINKPNCCSVNCEYNNINKMCVKRIYLFLISFFACFYITKVKNKNFLKWILWFYFYLSSWLIFSIFFCLQRLSRLLAEKRKKQQKDVTHFQNVHGVVSSFKCRSWSTESDSSWKKPWRPRSRRCKNFQATMLGRRYMVQNRLMERLVKIEENWKFTRSPGRKTGQKCKVVGLLWATLRSKAEATPI